MTRARDHASDCEWHFEQYPHECTCGAIVSEFTPEGLKAPAEPNQQPKERRGIK